METKILEESTLGTLEFEADAKRRALPDELPPPLEVRDLPREILKSAAVENLIEQNEEIMARLKVSLRRLNSIEADNRRLTKVAEDALHQAASTEDQINYLREKEKTFRDRLGEHVAKIDILDEKVQYFAGRSKEFETQLNQQLENSQRYQERIRTHVKPHLIQLKEYARALEEKNQNLEGENARREAQLRDLRDQMIEASKNARYVTDQAEIRVMQTTEGYEDTLKDFKEKLYFHTEKSAALEEKNNRIMTTLEDQTLRLRRVEQQAVELGNEVIEVRRQREELLARHSQEMARIGKRCEEFANDNARMKMEGEDLRSKVMHDYDRINALEKQNYEQKSQLESLRYLYNSRMEELEKLRVTLAALERLNVDLSSRLQESQPSP